MNGIHDVGGLTCFGSIVHEPDEPVFHAPWERRAFGVTLATGVGNLDEIRRAAETMDPLTYLAAPYYEHWLAALQTLLVEKGYVTEEELAAGIAKGPSPIPRPPLTPELAEKIVQRGDRANDNQEEQIPASVPAIVWLPATSTRPAIPASHGTFGANRALSHACMEHSYTRIPTRTAAGSIPSPSTACGSRREPSGVPVRRRATACTLIYGKTTLKRAEKPAETDRWRQSGGWRPLEEQRHERRPKNGT